MTGIPETVTSHSEAFREQMRCLAVPASPPLRLRLLRQVEKLLSKRFPAAKPSNPTTADSFAFRSRVVASRGRAMFAPGGRIDFATAAPRPASMRPGFGHCVSRIAEAKTTLESERKFVEGKVALGLRGTACFLLDFVAPRHLGRELRRRWFRCQSRRFWRRKHCFSSGFQAPGASLRFLGRRRRRHGELGRGRQRHAAANLPRIGFRCQPASLPVFHLSILCFCLHCCTSYRDSRRA